MSARGRVSRPYQEPHTFRRSRWGAWGTRVNLYQAALDARKARLRREARLAQPGGEAKPQVTRVVHVKAGQWYRLVDEHGREYGERHQKSPHPLQGHLANTRCRVCQPKPLSLYDELILQRNRLHRQAKRQP